MVLEWVQEQTSIQYEPSERSDIDLVMYGRRFGCLDQIRAAGWLEKHDVPYRFIDIGADDEAAHRLKQWVGYHSVPTFVVAAPGKNTPIRAPASLDGRRPRGLNRGTLITEPDSDQLAAFLLQHDLIDHTYH